MTVRREGEGRNYDVTSGVSIYTDAKNQFAFSERLVPPSCSPPSSITEVSALPVHGLCGHAAREVEFSFDHHSDHQVDAYRRK